MKEPTPLAHLVASSISTAGGRYQDSIVEATRKHKQIIAAFDQIAKVTRVEKVADLDNTAMTVTS